MRPVAGIVEASAADTPSQTFMVTNDGDEGPGTLRQAILDANANSGADTINFAIDTGAVIINLFSDLPDIADPVIIDGTTQPGFAGTPLITVANFGIKITGGDSTVRSLETGIVLENGGGNTVVGCRLAGLADGVLVNNSPNNHIGGATAAESNNIGENEYGVRITGGTSSGNIVTGNYIGLYSDGSDGRNTFVGVAIEDAPNNHIGRTTAGERNIISNNGGGSTSPANLFRGNVLIKGAAATGNVIQGNYIGTTIDGSADGAVTINGNRHNGVRIEDAPNNIVGGTVGTTPGGACTGACNLISGNKTNGGVYITGSGATGNSIVGNFIGTNASGTAIVSNPRGVVITDGASNNMIGNATAAGRNIVSGSIGGLQDSDGGITLEGSFNTVQGNYIGTDTTGSQLLDNIPNGILISGTDNTIGTAVGTMFGGACTGGCNLITPAGGPGIKIIGTTNPVGRNVVDYNYIGLNAAGTDALLGVNFPGAIWVVASDQNTIGHLPASRSALAEQGSRAPQNLICIQDVDRGDYVQFDDQTGAYSWKECRSGRADSGIGTVSTSISGHIVLRSSNVYASVYIATGSGLGRFEYPRQGLFDPSYHRGFEVEQVSSSPCECPTAGQQNAVSGVYLRDGANGNVIGSNNINQTAADPNSNIAPGSSSGINNDSGSNNEFVNNTVSNSEFANAIIGEGNKNLLRNESYLSHLGYETPREQTTIDLNGDGPDINDPLDIDEGANWTQNYATGLKLTRRANGDYVVTGDLATSPDGTFEMEVIGRYLNAVGGARVVRNEPTGIVFEIGTDANGNTLINRTFTEAEAELIGSFDRITMLTTVLTPSAQAGDTSEYSPSAPVPRESFDFDGDGKTDIAIFRPAGGNAESYWYILNSADGSVQVQQFGLGDDQIVPGDYQGDRKADLAIWRPSTGVWYYSGIDGDPARNFISIPWGLPSDHPVIGDFDDDGRQDTAVYRSSDSTWYIRNSLGGGLVARQWGLNSDKRVPADYNGDGQTDLAVYRDGTWYISLCAACPTRVENFGLASDIPVPADYDGDGAVDIAVWRPSNGIFYLNQSQDGFTAYKWGIDGDKPLRGDFDGDGKYDIGVFRPSDGNWYILQSDGVIPKATHWGQAGDIPVQSVEAYFHF